MELAILLATYNSEKYISEQIDSILNQSVKKYKLYIKDDGSTDQTIKIIKSYTSKHNNIILLDDGLSGRGPMNNFMWLLQNVEAQYYMFSDHDDIWLPKKVELTFEQIIKLERNNPGLPIIVHTDLKVVDENLEIISSSFWKYSKINPNLLKSFEYLSVSNGITGCTMIINNMAKAVALPVGKHSTMHDSWISLCVSCADGKIGYIDKPMVLYRQHFNNAIGASRVGSLEYYFFKLKTPFIILKNNYKKFRMANEINTIGVFRFILFKLLYFFKR